MLPFYALFLFVGFRWNVYFSQFNDLDSFAQNAIYTSFDVDSLREYQSMVDPEELFYQLIKFSSLENNYLIDYQIGVNILLESPLVVEVMIKSTFEEDIYEMSKVFILESVE